MCTNCLKIVSAIKLSRSHNYRYRLIQNETIVKGSISSHSDKSLKEFQFEIVSIFA